MNSGVQETAEAWAGLADRLFVPFTRTLEVALEDGSVVVIQHGVTHQVRQHNGPFSGWMTAQ